MMARIFQLNCSPGGVPKLPVQEATVVELGMVGDDHRFPDIHGGPDRALCLFSHDLIERLQDEGHSIDAGSSGENLTLAGLDWEKLKPGDRLRIGPDVQVEIMSYTAPCDLNAQWFRDGDYTRISQKKNPGWSRLYAKVLREGVVRPGDAVEVKS